MNLGSGFFGQLPVKIENYRTDRFINNNNEISIKANIKYQKQKTSRNS